MMQILINISDSFIKTLEKFKENGIELGVCETAILNGIPIPKGHGRLIDADKYKFDNEDGFCIGFGYDAMNVFKKSVDNALTVIEADKDCE